MVDKHNSEYEDWEDDSSLDEEHESKYRTVERMPVKLKYRIYMERELFEYFGKYFKKMDELYPPNGQEVHPETAQRVQREMGEMSKRMDGVLEARLRQQRQG